MNRLYTDATKAIGVNSERSLEKKRFVIAHLLGHYELHYKFGEALYAHRELSDKGKKEKEADYFARCLLMPVKCFRTEYLDFANKGLTEDDIVTLLQKHFSIPYSEVVKRIEEII